MHTLFSFQEHHLRVARSKVLANAAEVHHRTSPSIENTIECHVLILLVSGTGVSRMRPTFYCSTKKTVVRPHEGSILILVPAIEATQLHLRNTINPGNGALEMVELRPPTNRLSLPSEQRMGDDDSGGSADLARSLQLGPAHVA